MSLDLNVFSTNPDKEVEGVWEDFGDGARVLIARIGNKKFLEAYGKIPKGMQRMLERNILSDGKADELICGVMAETIILDWEGVADDGKEVSYSLENVKAMLLKHPNFRQLIWEIAQEAQRFHDEEKATTVKNSKSVSAGK